MPSVIAIVVTYRPAIEQLERLVRALRPQVDAIVVVDNGSEVSVSQWLGAQGNSSFRALLLGENVGVAAAQNKGLELAREQGAEYAILFDQDSLPAPDMVERLVEAVRVRQADGVLVAAVGPRYCDPRRQALRPFVRTRGLVIGRCDCRAPDDVLEVDHLISSGSLIPMSSLLAVGPMSEALFIDYVDTEWILRAKHYGFRAYGVCAASMTHSLGDAPMRVWGREVVVRSPLRHYYMFRNAIWMYRQSWIPMAWKMADGLRLLQKFMLYAVFAKPRLDHLRMMYRGTWHGLRGRMGRFDPVE